MIRYWIAAALVGLCTSARAQSVDLPVADRTFDISSIVKNLQPAAVLGWDMQGNPMKLAGGFYRLPWNFHDKSGTPFVEPSPGLAWAADGEKKGQGGPIFALGIRADNIYSRLLTNQWMRDHYLSPKCPYIKLGPYIGYINKLGLIGGGFVALEF